MSKIFVTSDTHFGHNNIIKYCNRPFQSREEMDETIICNWNSVISASDTVWFLGDLCFPKKDRNKYLARLNGKVVWLRGNHDSIVSENKDLDFIKVKEYQFILCHYPMISWRNKAHGSIMLFGHSHGMMNETIKNYFPSFRMLDVGVDSNNFFPVELDQIIERMKLIKF